VNGAGCSTHVPRVDGMLSRLCYIVYRSVGIVTFCTFINGFLFKNIVKEI
jgi:hypothetical protein